MLQVDHKDFKLTDDQTKTYSRPMKVMVPLSRVKRNPKMKNRVEAPRAQGITAEYNTEINGKRCHVRYFEASRWDPDSKRDVFTPHNILIGREGFFTSSDPELNWFLSNHPGWEGHSSRAKPGKKSIIMFRIHNPLQHSKRRMDTSTKLLALMKQCEKWDHLKLVSVCQTITGTLESNMPLPGEVVRYREYAEQSEQNTEVLRGAVMEMIQMHPNYVYDRVANSREQQVSAAVHALQMDGGPLTFVQKTRKWTLAEGEVEAEIYTVQKNADPTIALIRHASKEAAMGDKLILLANQLQEA